MVRGKTKPSRYKPCPRKKLSVSHCAKAVGVSNRESTPGQRKRIALSIPKLQFQKFARTVAWSMAMTKKWDASALLALQHATELFAVDFFTKMGRCAEHDGRVEVTERDLLLVNQIQGG